MKSINSHTRKKTVEKGLTIYQTGRSKFWHCRLWDRRNNKYVTKTSGETDRQEATIAARNWKDSYLQQASSHLVSVATSKDAFEYYARMIPVTSKDDWVILKRPSNSPSSTALANRSSTAATSSRLWTMTALLSASSGTTRAPYLSWTTQPCASWKTKGALRVFSLRAAGCHLYPVPNLAL